MFTLILTKLVIDGGYMPFFYKKKKPNLDETLLTNYIKSVTIHNNRHILINRRAKKKLKGLADGLVSLYQKVVKTWKKKIR